MNSFVMNLYDATNELIVEDVSTFVGMDASGSFGIQANHDRFMTTLVFGLARFRQQSEDWQYLALPGLRVALHFAAIVATDSHSHTLILTLPSCAVNVIYVTEDTILPGK